MRRLLVSVVLALTASQAVAANVMARLENQEGEVLVSSGKGFLPALAAQTFGPGDKVLLRGKASAVLNYAELGCVQSLREPGLYVVQENACAGGEATVPEGNFHISPAGVTYIAPPAQFTPTSMPMVMGLGFAGAVATTFIVSNVLLRKPVSGE